MAEPGVGIAGAMDYKAPAANHCVTCGRPVEGGFARAAHGLGVVQACSRPCADDPRFALAGGYPCWVRPAS